MKESEAFGCRAENRTPSSGPWIWQIYKTIQEDNRLCELGEDENESHFLLFCPHYDELRTPALTETSVQHADIFGG